MARRAIALRSICHSRAGDKGNDVNLSLICFDEAHYPIIRNLVTVERVTQHFSSMLEGTVERYEMPNIFGLNFVLHDVLGGGSTKGLRRDIHGKVLSGPLLDLEIEVPEDMWLLEYRV